MTTVVEIEYNLDHENVPIGAMSLIQVGQRKLLSIKDFNAASLNDILITAGVS